MGGAVLFYVDGAHTKDSLASGVKWVEEQVCGRMLTYADVCGRMLTSGVRWVEEQVCGRMLTYADVCGRMRTYADVCDVLTCMRTPAAHAHAHTGHRRSRACAHRPPRADVC